jgi:hypothetical protein
VGCGGKEGGGGGGDVGTMQYQIHNATNAITTIVIRTDIIVILQILNDIIYLNSILYIPTYSL